MCRDASIVDNLYDIADHDLSPLSSDEMVE